MTPPAETRSRAALAKGEILIVDDVSENVDILRRQLARRSFEIDCADSGAAALRRIATRPPDLVLLDSMMPGMSGMEVLEKIRADYSPSHLPVVMVTAISEVNAVVKAFEFGANDYIVKPFDFKVVLARVQGQIERLQAIRALETLIAAGAPGAQRPTEQEALAQAALVREAIAARKASEASLRIALEKAEAASRAKQAFLANMCHELRTPLNAVIGFSNILHTEVRDAHREYIRYIHKSGEHLLSILNALIRMSELEREHPALEKTESDAKTLVCDIAEILKHAADEKNVELTVTTCAEQAPLHIDAAAVRQALINIVSNGIKFSPEGGKVEIAMEVVDDERLAVTVEDRGVGLDEDKLAKLGEPFVRGDFGYEGRYEGMGLGFSIAKKIIEAHCGDLRIENREGGGARAVIKLPLQRRRPAARSVASGAA